MTTRKLIRSGILILTWCWATSVFCKTTELEMRFIDHLNNYYGLSIEATSENPNEVIKDLILLENVLHGAANAPAQSLQNISCSANECGGCGHAVCARR